MSTLPPELPFDLQANLSGAAFVFRGYNITNLGKTPELLAHPAYGRVVEHVLREASAVCSEMTGRPVDLAARVRERSEPDLEAYTEAVSLIIAAEMAQLKLLEQFFGIEYQKVRLAYGYSLGEIAALIAGGVMEMAPALRIPLAMAEDCVELAHDVTLGVLFSRGPALDLDAVNRLCLRINSHGEGVIGVSTYLSPNSLLLMGQKNTVSHFGELMSEWMPQKLYLRKNEHRWPPLHTPIMWQKHIPNRAAVMMHTLPGVLNAPTPPVLSLVTGQISYTDVNTRELLMRWIDHPQRLWDAVSETLAMGIETIVHVGPEPNLVPATYTRLAENVSSQLGAKSWGGVGLRAVSRAVRRPWLAKLLPTRSSLLRAPFVVQVILEDWLLQQEVE